MELSIQWWGDSWSDQGRTNQRPLPPKPTTVPGCPVRLFRRPAVQPSRISVSNNWHLRERGRKQKLHYRTGSSPRGGGRKPIEWVLPGANSPALTTGVGVTKYRIWWEYPVGIGVTVGRIGDEQQTIIYLVRSNNAGPRQWWIRGPRGTLKCLIPTNKSTIH